MQGSQTPWVIVLSSHTEGQLFTPSSEPHQAQTRYAVVLAEYSIPISAPFAPSRRLRAGEVPVSSLREAAPFQASFGYVASGRKFGSPCRCAWRTRAPASQTPHPWGQRSRRCRGVIPGTIRNRRRSLRRWRPLPLPVPFRVPVVREEEDFGVIEPALEPGRAVLRADRAFFDGHGRPDRGVPSGPCPALRARRTGRARRDRYGKSKGHH